MTGFGDLGGLSGESSFVGFAVENLGGLVLGGLVCGFLCGREQRTLLELTRSLATARQASEVTEDQGPRDAVQWAKGHGSHVWAGDLAHSVPTSATEGLTTGGTEERRGKATGQFFGRLIAEELLRRCHFDSCSAIHLSVRAS